MKKISENPTEDPILRGYPKIHISTPSSDQPLFFKVGEKAAAYFVGPGEGDPLVWPTKLDFAGSVLGANRNDRLRLLSLPSLSDIQRRRERADTERPSIFSHSRAFSLAFPDIELQFADMGSPPAEGQTSTEDVAPTDDEVDSTDMDEVSRYELDAKLETIETKMDARAAALSAQFQTLEASVDTKVASISSKIDNFIDRLQAAEAFSKERSDRVANDVEVVRAEMKGLSTSVKTIVIGTVIATGVATVIGIAAFNATVLSNMLASFESGRAVTQEQMAATHAIKEMQAELMKLNRERAEMAPQAESKQSDVK